MKFKRITMGMSLGSFWSNAERLEEELQAHVDAAITKSAFSTSVMSILKEQQRMIEQQQREIKKMKALINCIEENMSRFITADN